MTVSVLLFLELSGGSRLVGPSTYTALLTQRIRWSS